MVDPVWLKNNITSVFPGTSTVESDFLIINYKKDDYWKSLTNFSLEGILHSKQFKELNEIKALLIKL